MNPLDEFRLEKDQFFGQDPQSPLSIEQRRSFHGLNYYPENTALRMEAAVEEFDVKVKITMQTTTGGAQTYTRFGRFNFEVDGQTVGLTVFHSSSGYFLPFVDALAGKETYGAGRYLEPERLHDGKFRVDFNYAYNPYCAYNDLWSCPITPSENRVKVALRAGEKVFEDHPAA